MAEDRRRVVGLDIGSNTFSCAELVETADDRFRVVADSSRAVRLSEGLSRGGSLAPAAIERGLAALEDIVRDHALAEKELAAVGTAVLRMARNPEAFTRPAREILRAPIRILSQEEEALMTARGAVLGLDELVGATMVVDVGGQSTELCWRGGAKEPWRAFCLEIGVVALLERFLKDDPPSPSSVLALRREVRARFAEAISPNLRGGVVAVAGTATALGRLVLGLARFEREEIHGCHVARPVLADLTARVLSMTTAERVRKLGLDPGRADVFPAGLCVLEEILDHVGASRLEVSANGLRVGAAIEKMEE